MARFEIKRRISFADCDPAGIVFYPRYMEMINAVVEEWFADGLGKSFAELHLTERKGVPAVHIETEFPAPGRLGDELLFRLGVEKLGRSSIHLSLEGAREGEALVRAKLTLVHTDLETARAEPLPEALRAAIGEYVVTPGESP